MILVLLLTILACNTSGAEFEGSQFENEWWEFSEYPVCFNFHESGDVLLYERRISNEGPWYYCEPNQYEFKNGAELITVEPEDKCWTITGYSELASFVACECTLR